MLYKSAEIPLYFGAAAALNQQSSHSNTVLKLELQSRLAEERHFENKKIFLRLVCGLVAEWEWIYKQIFTREEVFFVHVTSSYFIII